MPRIRKSENLKIWAPENLLIEKNVIRKHGKSENLAIWKSANRERRYPKTCQIWKFGCLKTWRILKLWIIYIWKTQNLEIWKSENSVVWKSGNRKICNAKTDLIWSDLIWLYPNPENGFWQSDNLKNLKI